MEKTWSLCSRLIHLTTTVSLVKRAALHCTIALIQTPSFRDFCKENLLAHDYKKILVGEEDVDCRKLWILAFEKLMMNSPWIAEKMDFEAIFSVLVCIIFP